jgi:hypothetical protein
VRYAGNRGQNGQTRRGDMQYVLVRAADRPARRDASQRSR